MKASNFVIILSPPGIVLRCVALEDVCSAGRSQRSVSEHAHDAPLDQLLIDATAHSLRYHS